MLHEVLTAQGIELPLPDQGTTTDDNRYEQGRAVQAELYGYRMADSLAGLPDPFAQAVPRLLTEWAFRRLRRPVLSKVGEYFTTLPMASLSFRLGAPNGDLGVFWCVNLCEVRALWGECVEAPFTGRLGVDPGQDECAVR